ncbi:hypothetical protein [Haloimpatiens myeolchijeotgali]|uniref:hypothetical protein n=1 Tax=Haloimpatiens sp. FM7330 TaxID=3298610 RepID=UPI00384E4731
MNNAWEAAYAAQIVELDRDFDPECFYKLCFWGSRYDNRIGIVENKNFSLQTTAYLFWGDVLQNVIFNIDNGNIQAVDDMAAIRIDIFGVANQIEDVTNPVPPLVAAPAAPLTEIVDYDFESYCHLQQCECTQDDGCCFDKKPPVGTTKATILFLAQQIDVDPLIDPTQTEGGVWYIDDVIFA